MERVDISKITVSQNNEVSVCITGDGKAIYEYVYRAATGVFWNEELNCFTAQPSNSKNISECIDRIIEAVKNELGIKIYLSAQSDVSGIPNVIQTELVT